jgi:hypothetical protein
LPLREITNQLTLNLAPRANAQPKFESQDSKKTSSNRRESVSARKPNQADGLRRRLEKAERLMANMKPFLCNSCMCSTRQIVEEVRELIAESIRAMNKGMLKMSER